MVEEKQNLQERVMSDFSSALEKSDDVVGLYGILQTVHSFFPKGIKLKKEVKEKVEKLIQSETLQSRSIGEILVSFYMLESTTSLTWKEITKYLKKANTEFHTHLSVVVVTDEWPDIAETKSSELKDFAQYYLFEKPMTELYKAKRDADGSIRSIQLNGMQLEYDESKSAYVFDFIPFGISHPRDIVSLLNSLGSNTKEDRELLNSRLLEMFEVDINALEKNFKEKDTLKSKTVLGTTNPYFKSFIEKRIPQASFEQAGDRFNISFEIN